MSMRNLSCDGGGGGGELEEEKATAERTRAARKRGASTRWTEHHINNIFVFYSCIVFDNCIILPRQFEILCIQVTEETLLSSYDQDFIRSIKSVFMLLLQISSLPVSYAYPLYLNSFSTN